MKKNSKHLIWLFFFAFIVSCIPNEDEFNMDLIQKKLAAEGETYTKLRLFNCRQSLLVDVEKMVDSIIIHNLNFTVGAGIYFPSRPYKPNYIGNIRLNDSLIAKPFLENISIPKNTPSTDPQIIDSIK